MILIKKAILILLVFLLSFSLFGCSRKETVTVSPPSVSPSITSVEPSPEPTPSPTPRPLLDPQLTGYAIDPSFFTPASEQGTVVTAQYDTRDYMYGPSDIYTKNMRVYLPFGYDEHNMYDVLFLAHITGVDEFWWLDASHPYEHPDAGTLDAYLPNMLDNMIERGLCRPLIVIALNCYITEGASWEHNSNRDYYQFPLEFRNDILPAVQKQFAVYDTREHYGFLGASFGAYVDYLCVLSDCFDLVGWHCQTGGGTIYPSYLEDSWYNIGAQDMELCGLYILEGDHDDIGPVMEGVYMMQDYENFSYTIMENTGHDRLEWDTAVYNSLQIFFR